MIILVILHKYIKVELLKINNLRDILYFILAHFDIKYNIYLTNYKFFDKHILIFSYIK